MERQGDAFCVLISMPASLSGLLRSFGRSLRFRLCRSLHGVLPRESHRFSKTIFIHRIEPDGGAALAAPGATCGSERRGVRTDEILLLVWREFDHAPFVVGMERREDFSIGAKVWMTHVRAFDGSLHLQCEAAEFVRSHDVLFQCRLTKTVSA